MTTPKKKHLIELMIEAGVKWPGGAEYAAQDKKSNDLCFYVIKPLHNPRFKDEWRPSELSNPDGIVGNRVNLQSLCRNWNQTIVTREQYMEALAAATTEVQHEEQPEQKHCASVMRQMPDKTIEQLSADYRAKAAEADRLQAVADDALKAADDALLALEKAGELIGLVISIDTKPKQEAQPEITYWRDLLVGDVIECIEPWGGTIECGDFGVITEIDDIELTSKFDKQGCYYYKRDHLGVKFRFIRRP